MPYALLIVEKPPHGWPDDMLPAVRPKEPYEGVTALNESAWLLNLDKALMFLARVVVNCYTHQLRHHVLFLSDEPHFVRASETPVQDPSGPA